jgi:hypothetical protein
VAAGRYFVEQSVTVSCTDPDATLHYTLDATAPTESSPVVASGGTIARKRT